MSNPYPDDTYQPDAVPQGWLEDALAIEQGSAPGVEQPAPAEVEM